MVKCEGNSRYLPFLLPKKLEKIVNFDSLMGKSAKVWFCVFCDDQPPWKADEKQACPTCKSKEDVLAAKRFQNLTTEEDGTVRNV